MNVSNKHGIYEFPYEFPNDLTLRLGILGNSEKLGKSQKLYRIIT